MRYKADFLLLLATLFWGLAFAVMRQAAGHGTVFYLNGLRFLLGGLLLVPFSKIRGAFHRKNILYVFLAGAALFLGASFQQAGLATTSASNGGFITSLYMVIVPLILWLIWRERPAPRLGAAVLIAAIGGFFLSTGGKFQFNPGDLLVFVGAFFWALHVVVISRGQGHIEPMPFAMGQFLICGILNLITAAFLERPGASELLAVLPAILYTSIFSIAIGFTLQVHAQRHTPPADTALILSMEAVFAAVFGGLILHESLLPLQMMGCGMILLSVLLVQIRKNGTIFPF